MINHRCQWWATKPFIQWQWLDWKKNIGKTIDTNGSNVKNHLKTIDYNVFFLAKTITIPLWSKFYHRSGLTGFDSDRFWWDFKIICFFYFGCCCAFCFCAFRAKQIKHTLCAILWLCIFVILYFRHLLLARSHYSVIDGVLYIVTLYCSWCCVFATPYWPGHSVATLFSQKLGSARLEIFSNPQKTTSRCLCKFGEIKRTAIEFERK